MRILLFIASFLLLCTFPLAQSFSIVKGSVQGVSIVGDVVEARDSKLSASEFTKDTKLQLSDGWVWLGGETTLYVDNFEQFSGEDETAFVGNFRLNGSVDFKLEKLSEIGFFNITTTGASLDIFSKHFYVETSGKITYVECYDGKITMTNSDTMKDTVLEAGFRAKVFGQDGDTNLLIEIVPLSEEQKLQSEKRITIVSPTLS
jgi:hypothetical protein